MAKIGERFVEDMVDRGRRELGGFLYPDSNIAQPTYPLRGGQAAETPALGVPDLTLAERLDAPLQEFKGPEHDEPDRGFERE